MVLYPKHTEIRCQQLPQSWHSADGTEPWGYVFLPGSCLCVQQWPPRCCQQRKSQSTEAEPRVFLLYPAWMERDSTGSCAQSWLGGQGAASPKLVVPQEGWPESSACPPQPQSWVEVPTAPAGTSQLSRRPLAVQEQSRLWEGVPWVKCLWCCQQCPALLCTAPRKSPGVTLEPGADFTDQILQIKLLVLGQSLPWTSIWPSWLLGFTLRHDLGKQPSDQTAQIRGRAGLGWPCLCQLSGQLCFFVPLPFPFPTSSLLTLARLSGSVKSQLFPGLVVLWDLYLGSAAEM